MLWRSFGRFKLVFVIFLLVSGFTFHSAQASFFGAFKTGEISSSLTGYSAADDIIRVADPGEMTLPQIRKKLRRRGYRKIRFFDRELPVYRAHACKGANRFLLHMNRFGNIDRQSRAGACNNVKQAPAPRVQPRAPRIQPRRAPGPREMTLPQIRKKLRRRGYRKIRVFDRELPVYRAHACKGANRFLLHMNRFGNIDRQSRAGACNNANQAPAPRVQPRAPRIQPRRALGPREMTLPQIRKKLRRRGYRKIRVFDRELPVYRAHACKGANRFLLHMNRFGNIDRQSRAGACNNVNQAPAPRAQPRAPRIQPRRGPDRRGLSLPQIRRNLRNQGFDEIRFTDRQLPTYKATACKGNVRYRLRLNRWAAVSKKTRVGRCGFQNDRHRPRGNRSPRADDRIIDDRKRPPQIRKLLQNRGFNQITFTDRRLPTYVVRACKKGRRLELRIDGSGRIRKRNRIGRCRVANKGLRPPQIRKVLQTRGFSRILFTDHQLPTYVVEACRHDRKFELRLNRFGRVNRKTNIGRCRVQRAQRGFEPREVREILRRRGYREIDFFDRRLPGYGVEACRRGQKFRMRINRFAEIRKRRRTGFCRPPARSAPPVQYEYEEIDEEQISGTEQIDPETCQSYLDTLVHRNRIHFDVASASLRRGSYNLLERLSRVMNRCPSSRIEIAGHTDSDGSRDYNRDLSRRRAKTVAGFLAQEGISLRRMTAYGYGEDQPLMRHEETERDKARNRRIEFTVIWGDDSNDDDDDDYRRSRR